MKIVAIRERAAGEFRTAITPEVARLLTKAGYNVYVEKNIGKAANFSDQDYIDAGAHVSSVLLEIISDANVIFKVQPTPLIDQMNELDLAAPRTIIIGLLSSFHNKEYLRRLKEKQMIGISMELVPRISRTQNMDVLSSQSNLAGYRAVIEGCYYFTRVFPMMMTAAGTISPAKVLVIGAGVAGLQAIATAKRLGASVSAYDVRAATKEQVESLGAKFVSPVDSKNMQDASGYAKEHSGDDKQKHQDFLSEILKNYDIVITTALIPGKEAPRLITESMIKSMKAGSVIVDIATSNGGNAEMSKKDEIVEINGVKIIGWSNLAAKIAMDSSKFYSKNLYNLFDYATSSGANEFQLKDEIIKQMIVSGEPAQ